MDISKMTKDQIDEALMGDNREAFIESAGVPAVSDESIKRGVQLANIVKVVQS